MIEEEEPYTRNPNRSEIVEGGGCLLVILVLGAMLVYDYFQ